MPWSDQVRKIVQEPATAGLSVLVSLVLLFTVPMVGLGFTAVTLVLVLLALRVQRDRERQLERARKRAARWRRDGGGDQPAGLTR